jgi:tetratricopeptide (TPR) repeat protein
MAGGRSSGALRNVQGLFVEALRHHRAGRIDVAVAHYQRLLALSPGYANAHNNLGLALVAQGRIGAAITHYERALTLNPGYVDAHNNLGIAFVAHGRIDDAVAHYERALALKPDCANTYCILGIALAAQGRIDDAVARYERALLLKPDFAEAHYNLGIVLNEQGKRDDAVAHYERALALKPDFADAHNSLGIALTGQGRIDDAAAHYERALAIKPDFANAHNNLGLALVAQGRIDDAVAHYRRALAINPDHAESHNNLAIILKDLGQFDEAIAHYGRAIAIKPDNAEAHFNRADLKTFRPGDPDLAALEALAAGDLSADKAVFIHFALAKALEDTGDYVQAFEHLLKGNALKRRQIDYDEPSVVQLFQRISSVFDGSLFDRFQGEGDPSPVPVFVVGMPRSGSTLIEQILASHPQIHGAGELADLEIAANTVFSAGDRQFPECIPALDGVTLRRIGHSYLGRLPALANDKIRIVDKNLNNFLRVGLIRLILPNARIIHSVRHPIDTCASCYSKLFTEGIHFSYDMAELACYYRCYRELMTHWRSVLSPGAMLDVSYEDLVDDLEGQARRLIDYCGLPWDERCINFHATNRPVKTASAVQVRQPLFRGSLQRWHKYEAGLAPLLCELGDLIPSHALVEA